MKKVYYQLSVFISLLLILSLCKEKTKDPAPVTHLEITSISASSIIPFDTLDIFLNKIPSEFGSINEMKIGNNVIVPIVETKRVRIIIPNISIGNYKISLETYYEKALGDFEIEIKKFNAPEIHSISHTKVTYKTQVTIVGANFGRLEDVSLIGFRGTITEFSGDTIKYTIYDDSFIEFESKLSIYNKRFNTTLYSPNIKFTKNYYQLLKSTYQIGEVMQIPFYTRYIDPQLNCTFKLNSTTLSNGFEQLLFFDDSNYSMFINIPTSFSDINTAIFSLNGYGKRFDNLFGFSDTISIIPFNGKYSIEQDTIEIGDSITIQVFSDINASGYNWAAQETKKSLIAFHIKIDDKDFTISYKYGDNFCDRSTGNHTINFALPTGLTSGLKQMKLYQVNNHGDQSPIYFSPIDSSDISFYAK